VTRNGRNGSTPFRGTFRSDASRFFAFMYSVYILYSEKCRRYYVGYAADVEARLQRHNGGLVTATKNCYPYKICGTKSFNTETQARKEEYRIKKQKSSKYIEWLLNGNW
jgi:putative endonuclease